VKDEVMKIEREGRREGREEGRREKES